MLDLYTLETSMAAGGDGAAGAVEPAAADPAVEPDQSTGEEYIPAEQTVESIPLPDVEAIIQARVEETVSNLLSGFQPPVAGATPGPMSGQPPLGGHDFDWSSASPYEDDFGPKLGAGVQQAVNQAVQAAISPLLQAFTEQQEQREAAEAEQNVQDMIASEIAAHGDIPEGAKEMIRPLAEHLLPDLVRRFGNTPRAHEIAIEKAAAQIRQTLKDAAGQLATQEQNRLATLASAPAEPGQGAGAPLVPGAAIKVPQVGEIARKYATAG